MRIYFSFLIVAVVLVSCNGVQSVKNVFREKTPYARYVKSLEQANLDRTVMARLWVAAGERALRDSVIVPLPYAEAGYFKAHEPDARSYTFIGKEGQILTVNGSINTYQPAKMFVDVFIKAGKEWKPVVSNDSSLVVSYEFTDTDTCLLRLQPELLASAYYTLGIAMTPVLINPVLGATNKSIGSFWGDSRDGGKRSHEGIDIFAKKGTPVVAPTDGYVTRVGTSKLGGKVVWMKDRKRGHSYYFAHLDSQAVKSGMSVNQGDILGTVGNTGNAKHTPSHLHFGIYQSGARDPIDFVRTLDAVADALPWDTTLTDPHFKVMTKVANLRLGPSERIGVARTLLKGTYVRILAQSETWFRVQLPDLRQGFIYKNMVAPLSRGKRFKIKAPATLYTTGHDQAVPVAHLPASSSVEVLAMFDKYKYVITKEGIAGWMQL